MMPVVIRQLFAYDRWANGRLLDVVAALPAEDVTRDLGKQWSCPTLKAMFSHILGAQMVWLARFKGESLPRVPGDADFADLETLRARWDEFEREMQRYVEGLGEADLAGMVDYTNTRGESFRLPLWALLQHVANHSTHHRSEAATMLTLVQGSPPLTDLYIYHLIESGQLKG